ncbi:pyruvate dehydrogenase (acetyl-transferring) E1 component subunit alpha [Myxococcota bacterium]|nr:pyruvate dehydrogenase (acetyl-transferring) E1 component subunit alpha [Myxococcota bacterium]
MSDAEATAPTLDEMRSFYREMLLQRRFEEAAARVYTQGKIGGFCHLYIGQEAVGTGAIRALRPDDYVVTAYRDHGHALSKGSSSRAVMAELFGRSTGTSQGLGGSMHLFDVDRGLLGGYGIVGGHVPLAAGVAFASKYRGDGRVTLCFMGDGAVNQGVFFEAMQLASLWSLPVVFIVENNLYAMGTPLSMQTPVEDISLKAVPFGMDRDRFEDRDVFEVRRRVGRAVDRAREEGRPTFLEVLTYRYRGHSMSDPARYRTKEEVEERRLRDPLLFLEQRIKDAGAGGDLAAIEESVAAEVEDALEFAENSPPPDPEVATRFVYA